MVSPKEVADEIRNNLIVRKAINHGVCRFAVLCTDIIPIYSPNEVANEIRNNPTSKEHINYRNVEVCVACNPYHLINRYKMFQSYRTRSEC